MLASWASSCASWRCDFRRLLPSLPSIHDQCLFWQSAPWREHGSRLERGTAWSHLLLEVKTS